MPCSFNCRASGPAEEAKAQLEEHKAKMVAAIAEGKASLAASKKELDASIGNHRRAGHASDHNLAACCTCHAFKPPVAKTLQTSIACCLQFESRVDYTFARILACPALHRDPLSVMK